jgi:outer membrane beta-barrel protein
MAQDLEAAETAPATSPAAPAANTEQDIESLYDRDDQKQQATPAPKAERTATPRTPEVSSLSDLANLAPFDDVAVIQRRFLPKTGRFELSGTAFTNLNNPFFNAFGAGLRGAYYIREKYALEGLFTFNTNSPRQVTDDLENKRRVTTDNVLTSKGYIGASLKWNPIYGKITWLNKTIVPFDLNFNIGGGMTRLDNDENAPTLHFGTSQVFALSKGMAFRWDLIWNMYSGEASNDDGSKETLTQNDLFLGVGMSFYFPEAGYR